MKDGRLWPAHLVAGGGRCYLADDEVPVVAETDADGRVVVMHSWRLSPAHRHLPTTTDLAIQGDDLLVASPAAGGLVRIDRGSGAATVTPFPIPPAQVVVDGESVWVVGDSAVDPGARPNAGGQHHPVRRETPTLVERAQWRLLDLAVRSGSADAESDDDLTDGAIESALVTRERRVYRLTADGPADIDVRGEPGQATALDGTFVCVCWRDDDPLVVRSEMRGMLSFERPATVITVDPAGEVRAIASVQDDGGSMMIDGGRVWLVGYARQGVEGLRSVDPHGAGIATVADPRVDQVLAIVDDVVLGGTVPRSWLGLAPGPGRDPTTWWLVPLGRSRRARRRVELPEIVDDVVGVDGSAVWLVRADGGALVSVDMAGRHVREVPLAIHCADRVPEPAVPEGVDIASYERAHLDQLRDTLTGGWVAEDGTAWPYIRGITFDDFVLDGAFPDTAVVVLFHADGYPDVQFGRSHRLYDALGRTLDAELENATVELMENVEAAGYGLPAPEECVPDDAGVVWF